MHREHIKNLPNFENPTPLSERLCGVLEVAAWAHKDQYRKLSHASIADVTHAEKVPYIIHPYTVMYIAMEATDDEDVLAACLLHDTIENVPELMGAETITTLFGKRVADMVCDVTKNKSIPDWQLRNENYLQHIRHDSTEGSLIICAADKIHNLIDIIEQYEARGESIWSSFNAGRDAQLWWYSSVYALLNDRMPNNPLTHQLGELVKLFEQQIAQYKIAPRVETNVS